jgi:hypothetical protein
MKTFHSRSDPQLGSLTLLLLRIDLAILAREGPMTESSLADNGDDERTRRSRWAATWKRWFQALNTFLERGFRVADVDTGC